MRLSPADASYAACAAIALIRRLRLCCPRPQQRHDAARLLRQTYLTKTKNSFSTRLLSASVIDCPSAIRTARAHEEMRRSCGTVRRRQDRGQQARGLLLARCA